MQKILNKVILAVSAYEETPAVGFQGRLAYVSLEQSVSLRSGRLPFLLRSHHLLLHFLDYV